MEKTENKSPWRIRCHLREAVKVVRTEKYMGYDRTGLNCIKK